MANTEWWQRGPVDGVPAILQPVAHILLQVRESVDELVEKLTDPQWNARPGGVASAAFHVRHITGVIDRLFTYARGEPLSEAQFAALRSEGDQLVQTDVQAVREALHARIDAAVAQLRATDVATLCDFRAVGRARLPSTVIGCLVHGAEHAMRHVGQLSVTTRISPHPPVSAGATEQVEPDAFRARELAASLTVRDLQASLAWYRDVMGFTVARQFERDGKLRAASLKAGDVRILLSQDDGAKGLERTKGEGLSLQLTTAQSVDELARRIKERGGVLESEPVDGFGARVFRLRDPDGFRLVISSER
jgi:uncharacterized glyoxalase superfamily protein PhnB